jgi:hypothetical protein
MKRIIAITICLFLCAVSLFALPESPTLAEATVQSTYFYAKAAKTDGYFFTDKNLSTSLFAVPYTYCVQVIRDDGEWYYAKYAEDTGVYRALYGYCLKADFTPLSEKPDVYYLYKLVTVTYTANDSSTFLPVLNQFTADAAFYGTYYSGGAAYSYVLCNGSFGYISGANDDYPLILDEEEEQPAAATTEQENATDNRLVTAIILAFLACATLLILFFTAKKHSRVKDD